MPAATILHRDLLALKNPAKAVILQRFFKTGPGQYGEGDRFLGITVPQQRILARKYRDIPLASLESLLASPWHESRLTALIILTLKYPRTSDVGREEIFQFYLKHTAAINNWDLVDVSAPAIIGIHLLDHPDKRPILDQLARSNNLWEQRIAIVATFPAIRQNHFSDILRLAETMLTHPHDLMHKAVGWMLREIGKRDIATLEGFLDIHAAAMPRTMLRYAIEKFPATKRAEILGRKKHAARHG